MENNENAIETTVNVNGKDVPLVPFVNNLIGNSIIAMVKSLKGVNDVKEINIKIDVK